MGPEGEPQGFCGKKKDKIQPEAFFAVEGEEEMLIDEDGRRLLGSEGVPPRWRVEEGDVLGFGSPDLGNVL